MSTRQQSIRFFMFAMILILPLCINACNNGSSSKKVTDTSDFVSAAPEGSRNTFNGVDDLVLDGGAAEPLAGDADDVIREIEEADIIKIEGTLLYILNQYRGLFICDISTPDSPSILGRAAVSGEPLDMYIREGRAYVIVSLSQYLYYDILEAGGGSDGQVPEAGSRVIIVDVSNPESPVVDGSVDLDGRVTDSRIVGDILYVVSTEDYYYSWVDDIMVGVARDIVNGNGSPGTYVASIDISDPAQAVEVDREALEGASAYIHVTDAAIFVPSTEGYYHNDLTTITYVDISDPAGEIRKRGNISIPGCVEDKFKMDYVGNYFRVCAYEWDEGGGQSSLRVINVVDPDNMYETGSVVVGQGEQLFATRFDGDRAYMVTFERVDPLWVIDLSDEENPQIAGELIVPGWSTHIEPRGDRLIALGVDNDDGWKVSVSLFDVADPADPDLVERVSFGDDNGWTSSTAYDDVKALTIIDELGLILLPYSTSSWNDNQYASENRLQLIDYAPDDLDPRGWVAQDGSVLRSRSFEDRLFSVSSRQLQVINAADRDNPVVTATLPLMDNIVDFEPLNSQYGIRVVQDNDGAAILQAVPMQDPEYGAVAGEISLDADESYSAMFLNGEHLYVVSSFWEYMASDLSMPYYYDGSTTRVTVYDFSDIVRPERKGSLDLEGSYTYMPQPDLYDMIYPYYYRQGEFHRLGRSTLVFIDSPQDNYYPILYDFEAVADGSGGGGEMPFVPPDDGRDDDPEEETTVTVVDLSNAETPAVVSEEVLTYDPVSGFFVNNNTLCFSYFAELDNDDKGRPQVQYSLGRLDLNDPAAPVELDGIGIPGPCLGLSADGVYGYTVNMEWTGSDEERAYSFNTIQLDGSDAALLDTVGLGARGYSWYYGYDYVLSENRACFSGFSTSRDNEAVLKVIDTGTPRDLKDYDHDFGANGWMSLMDASGSWVFLRVSDTLACYDTVDPGDLVLDEYQSPAGWGNRVVFSGSTAYVPMGYYGLWVKGL